MSLRGPTGGVIRLLRPPPDEGAPGCAPRTLRVRWCCDRQAADAFERGADRHGSVRVLAARASSPQLFAAVSAFEAREHRRVWLEPANEHQGLGEELDTLIVRIDATLTPAWLDALAATVGALRAGGRLALWPDPALGVPPDAGRPMHTPFVAQVLAACRAASRVEAGGVPGPNGPFWAAGGGDGGHAVAERDPRGRAALRERLARWMAQASHAAPRVIWVTGPRGAGKSTLVAEAWLRAAPTLPTPPVLIARYPSASKRFEGVAAAGGRPLVRRSRPPVEATVAGRDDAAVPRLWIVEEAAQWPAETLLGWARAGRRLCLVSTAAGYEGSGAGLTQTLLEGLAAEGLGVEVLALSGAVRHDAADAVGCWLETFWPEVLGAPSWRVSARGTAAQRRSDGPPSKGGVPALPTVSLVVGQAPEAARPTLRWLAQGHYRTRPSDVWRWLDDASLRLFVQNAPDGHEPLAAALVQVEPGLDPETVAAVRSGQRRPGGARLTGAWALAGVDELAGAPAWRVMRLLVNRSWRGRGLGRRLVGDVVAAAAAANARSVGAAFGATPRLLAFWAACGFGPLQTSARRDPMTGRPAVMVARRLNG